MADLAPAPEGAAPPRALSVDEAQDLAARHGLRTLGERPPLTQYLRDLWRRRSFLWTLSRAESYAVHEANALGQLWSVLNPALLIGSYYLIFGLLLSTRGNIENFVGFLSIGVVMFAFTSAVVTRGARAITGRLGLVRTLHFPRAILPMSVTLSELFASLAGFGLLFVLMFATGEPAQWKWFLFPLAVALQAITLLGLALITARLVNVSADIANLVPVAVRLLRYVSGVFFPVAHYVQNAPALVQDVLTLQPFALMLTTSRQALLSGQPVVVTDWIVMLGWAVVTVAVGLVVFWRAEARYGLV